MKHEIAITERGESNMRAARTVNSWTKAWGLTLFLILILDIFPAQAQQDTLTDRAEHGDDPLDHNPKHHHYKLIDTGALGGAISSLGFEGERDINDRGTVVSLAETSIPDPYAPNCFFADCFVGHVVDWRDGVLTDLGALPSVNNSGPIWISDSGLIGGFSQNGLIDPLTGNPEFQAVLFKDSSVIDLGTLGGNESSAFGVNDRGQVVGCAANAVPDSFGFCFGVPQQSRAFLWQRGGMKDLGTLGGPDALAELVNDRGQVAGWSLTDSTVNAVTGIPTQHPFLWEKGEMRDLGTIGGTKVYLVNSLNNRGHVVGGMYVAGDQSYHPFLWDGDSLKDLGTFGGDFGSADWINEAGDVVGWALTAENQSHAFLWQKGLLTDLGTVDGDPSSTAFVVNSKRQVVGATQDNNFSYVHAFLWERGSIVDLNALIPDDSRVRLMAAVGLNDRGEIVAQGVLPNGDLHAFLLIPCDENHRGDEGCDYSLVDEAAATRQSQPSVMQEPSATAPRTPALYGPSNDVRRMFPGRLGSSRFVGGPQLVASRGAVPATSGPIATLSPTSEAFSTQAIGTTGAGKIVTLKNTGTTSVTITAIAIAGTNAGDFAQTHTCGSSLAAGTSCSISVTFKPTASGTRTAALSVTDNAAGSPQKASLTGIGTTAKLSPTSLSFGTVVLGTSSPANPVTLTNVGTTTLTIRGIAITGTNAGDFAQTHTCGSSLTAGASCTVSVTFKPTQIGKRTGTLSVTDNAPGSPQTVSLSGTGTDVQLSPTRLGFSCTYHIVLGCVCVKWGTATLTNVGSTTLNISGIAISGPFSQTNSCGVSVAAGGSCSINVRWSPSTGTGIDHGLVSISDNGGASPQMLGLIGYKVCSRQ
jgi:probable HAF family extracellular repeat protein